MRIAICGFGRAGKSLAHKIVTEGEHVLCAVLNRDESASVGKDSGELLEMPANGIKVTPISDAVKVLTEAKADVVIDFSNKDTTLKLAKICIDAPVSYVVCTTSFSNEQLIELKSIGEKFNKGLIYAPNLTVGINLLMDFVRQISLMLPDFDFEIVERHSKGKPRVTTTAKVIASKIERDEVPISSVRVGGYVGVHEVTAANKNERITIVHESFTREAFAHGALLAASYINRNPSGYHEMSDVIQEMKNAL